LALDFDGRWKLKLRSRSTTNNFHAVISHSLHSHSTLFIPPVKRGVSALRGASFVVTTPSFEEEIEVGRGKLVLALGHFRYLAALSYFLAGFSVVSQVPSQKRFLLAGSLSFIDSTRIKIEVFIEF
jgi:hypothetical protein